MTNLGVIDYSMSSNERWFKQLTEKLNSPAIIQKKEELMAVSGVVIPLTEKEKLPSVLNWLRICQNNPKLFVWVFSTVPLGYEQDVLLELGANEVVTDAKQIHRLSLIIRNTFQRIKLLTQVEKKLTNGAVINEQNQSVYINGQEQLLTRNEYKLFMSLYQNESHCVSYDQLIADIWPNNPKVSLYILANVVFHLRSKVKDSNDFTIKTIRNKGYMLINYNK